jgi:hypothetical protein
VWKTLRIVLLLLVLTVVAGQQLLDRHATRSWRETLWVGIFPVNADGSAAAARYLAGLTAADFEDLEAFLAREAHRYGLPLESPVHVELYPQVAALPPELPEGAGLLGIAAWSLKLRYFAWRHADFAGRAPARIRLFVLYHDAASLQRAPASHGLEKGLVGLVHAFAAEELDGSNALVIAHELLHTVGASDKYDPATGLPRYPLGFPDPGQQPLYPQQDAEIMAGRRALSPTESEMPRSLAHVVVGPATALEIGWTRR